MFQKNAVKAARKILKTAYKEKVLDKVLTKEENEILVKFFSGKIPYDQKVLQILDRYTLLSFSDLDTVILRFDRPGSHFTKSRKRAP